MSESLSSALPQERRKSSESIERAKSYIEEVVDSMNTEETYLGRGAAGVVFTIPDTGFCGKVVDLPYVPDDKDIPVRVTPETRKKEILFEANIQIGAESIVTEDGVRSPVMLDVLVGERHCVIVMEELDAVRLDHILNGWEKAPEGFDGKYIGDLIWDYVSMLHDKGISHNDIAARNIMVDRKTGGLYVIDFGQAVVLPADSSLRKRAMRKEEEEVYAVQREYDEFVDGIRVISELKLLFEEIQDFDGQTFSVTQLNPMILKNVRKKIADGKHHDADAVYSIAVGAQKLYYSKNKDKIVGSEMITGKEGSYYIGFLKDKHSQVVEESVDEIVN